MKILVLGMSHRTAPLEVRERFSPDAPGAALRKLTGSQEIHEAVLVATCNRVDLVVTTTTPEAALHRVNRFFKRELAQDYDLEPEHTLHEFTYEYWDRDAVNHVFRVASSLDSMVVGEPQILGQMKDAYRLAVESRSCGPVLSRLFQRAFATAKRVKNETRIAQRPVSVARVAVDLARQIFEELDDKKALLVGAGEMIELALLALQRDGLREARVVNRTLANAEELAQRFRASAHALDELDVLLGDSDVVLTCVAGDQPILGVERVREALDKRRSKPVFFIDIGVPRNVDPRVNQLDSAYLYDVDDLQSVADANAGERVRESQRGEVIVEEERQRFDGWLAALGAVPTIRHLRARAEAIRTTELARAHGRLDLDARQQEGIEALTRAIVNKLLHAPLARLRAESDREAGIASLEVARMLFALDDPSAPGAHADQELRAELERDALNPGSDHDFGLGAGGILAPDLLGDAESDGGPNTSTNEDDAVPRGAPEMTGRAGLEPEEDASAPGVIRGTGRADVGPGDASAGGRPARDAEPEERE